MECKSCNGEKPKCEAKDFTKAVVEINEPEQIVLFRKVVVPASLGDDTTYPPKIGKYHNVILYYEANDNIYLYSSDGIPTLVTANVDKLKAALNKEISDREAADAAIEEEIEELRNNPDVVDIVDTYADLQAYDTSKLGDKDIIRVLEDETHDGASTYYRWDKPNSTWDYIGEAGDYYTKGQVDTLLGAKQNTLVAGTNIQIAADGVTISATDTTYSAGTGLDLNDTTFSVDTTAIQEKLTAGSNIQINGTTISATDTTYSDFVGATSAVAGTHGLVPAPTTADVDKVLKGDGTWGEVNGGEVYYVTPGEFATDNHSCYIYHDSALTQKVTTAEFSEAALEGDIRIIDSNIVYTVTSFVDNDGTNFDPVNNDLFFTVRGATSNTELEIWINAGSTDSYQITQWKPLYNVFSGATSQQAGSSGLVPAPAAGDDGEFLKADGTWATPTGTTYTAGTGIDITNNIIAIDNTVVQEKLTAGTGIAISAQNVISASPNNISSNDWSALWQ